jgi:hypothetical protein
MAICHRSPHNGSIASKVTSFVCAATDCPANLGRRTFRPVRAIRSLRSNIAARDPERRLKTSVVSIFFGTVIRSLKRRKDAHTSVQDSSVASLQSWPWLYHRPSASRNLALRISWIGLRADTLERRLDTRRSQVTCCSRCSHSSFSIWRAA